MILISFVYLNVCLRAIHSFGSFTCIVTILGPVVRRPFSLNGG